MPASSPKIIYIAGYGRSGSSILGVLLGAHPRLFNAGALGQVRTMLRTGMKCSCGVPLKECLFWADGVRADGDQSLRGLTAFAAHRAEASHVIDCSKTAYVYALRPYQYIRGGQDVLIVHLVRRLSGVLQSALKGTNSSLEGGAGEPNIRSFEKVRTLIGWVQANVVAAIYGWLYADRYILVEYEQLCRDPHRQLDRIGRRLRVDLVHAKQKIHSGQPFECGHELAGNRLLRSRTILFRQKPAAEAPESGLWAVLCRATLPWFRARDDN